VEDATGSHIVEDDMEIENNDIAVSVSFTSFALTTFAFSLADVHDYWIVDYTCSVNLTTFKLDFRTFARLLGIAPSVMSVSP
jgi:hypothetical protein